MKIIYICLVAACLVAVYKFWISGSILHKEEQIGVVENRAAAASIVENSPRSGRVREQLQLLSSALDPDSRKLSESLASDIGLTDAEKRITDELLQDSYARIREHHLRSYKEVEDEKGIYFEIPKIVDAEISKEYLSQRLAEGIGDAKAKKIMKAVGKGRLFNYFGKYRVEMWIEEISESVFQFREKYLDDEDQPAVRVAPAELSANIDAINELWGHILSRASDDR